MVKQPITTYRDEPLFRLLSSKKLSKYQLERFSKTFKKEAYFYFPHDLAHQVFILLNGRVQIGQYGKNGKILTKSIMTNGDVFGELVLIGQKKRRDFAVALTLATCYVIPVHVLQQMIQSDQDLYLYFIRMMGKKSQQTEGRLNDLSNKKARTRIIEFVIDQGRQHGIKVGFEILVRQFMKHFEIACITATSRQSVTTVLNELRDKNLITFNRKRLLIRDLQALKAEAQNCRCKIRK